MFGGLVGGVACRAGSGDGVLGRGNTEVGGDSAPEATVGEA